MRNPGEIQLDSLPGEGDGRWRRSKVGARTVAAAACGVLVLFLGGCSSRGVRVPPGAADLEPCPVATIDVTSLAQMGEPGCNLAGSTLRFPTGEDFELGEPGSGGGIIDSRTPTREVRAANWGIPGAGAVDITDCVVTVWGSTQWAVELQLKALALEGIQDRVN